MKKRHGMAHLKNKFERHCVKQYDPIWRNFATLQYFNAFVKNKSI